MLTFMRDKLDQIQINFLWTGVEDKKRHAFVVWERVCKHKTKGGLGIHNLSRMNLDLVGKLI